MVGNVDVLNCSYAYISAAFVYFLMMHSFLLFFLLKGGLIIFCHDKESLTMQTSHLSPGLIPLQCYSEKSCVSEGECRDV